MTNEILLGDYRNLFPQIPSESVDVVFADPPFNLKKKYSSTKDNMKEKDYLAFVHSVVDEMIRVLKDGGSLFIHNIPKWCVHHSNYLLSKKMEFVHWISWDAPGTS